MPEISMDTLCETCGKCYGQHCGDWCPTPGWVSEKDGPRFNKNSLFVPVKPKPKPEIMQKDNANYGEIERALVYLTDYIGEMEINLRNEDVLSTMYEDLNHMREEIRELARLQKECPYELV